MAHLVTKLALFVDGLAGILLCVSVSGATSHASGLVGTVPAWVVFVVVVVVVVVVARFVFLTILWLSVVALLGLFVV